MAGRMQRERERHHRSRGGRARGAAGQPGAVTAAALDQRHPGDPAPQRLDDLQPGGVLASRRAGRPAAPDPVRLADPGHGAAEPPRRVRRGQQVRAGHTAARAVGEGKQEGRGGWLVELGQRRA